MAQVGVLPRLAVQPQALHVDVAAAVGGRLDHQLASVRQLHGRLLEQRRADRVVRAADLQRVEAERAEQVPGGRLAVVLVTGVALPDLRADVHPPQRLAHLGLGLPRLPGVVVHVRDVVRDLVREAPLAHAHVARLGHLVDHAAVGADELGRLRRREELVELVRQPVAPAVQVGQALPVVRHVEREVPAVGLGVVVVVAPDPRVVLVRGGLPRPVRRAALEEADRRVEHVHVVLRAAAEVLRLLAVAAPVGRRRPPVVGQPAAMFAIPKSLIAPSRPHETPSDTRDGV